MRQLVWMEQAFSLGPLFAQCLTGGCVLFPWLSQTGERKKQGCIFIFVNGLRVGGGW